MSVKTAHDIRQSAPVELPTMTALQRAIYEAAAPIHYGPDVAAYKERMRRKLGRRFWLRQFGVGNIGSMITAAILALGFGIVASKIGPSLWLFLPLLFVTAAFAMASLCFFADIIRELVRPSANRATWSRTDYSSFAGSSMVPSEIRKRARTIRSHCPEAVLTVEYLMEDPFLKVQHHDEMYYVGVWGEKGFIS